MGEAHLCGDGHLCGQTVPGRRLGQAVAGAQARHLLLRAAVDDDEAIEPEVAAGFHEQGGVGDEQGSRTVGKALRPGDPPRPG